MRSDRVLPVDFIDLALLGALACFGLALIVMASRLRAARAVAAAPLVEATKHALPNEQASQSLKDVVENLPHGIAIFDSQDRLSFCNAKFASIFPEEHHHMVPGRPFEEIMTKIAHQGTFRLEDETLERFIAQRLARHRDAPGKPFIQPLNDGRWIQINEIKTAGNGTLATWTDVTQLKLRELALAILTKRSTREHGFLEIAAEAIAVGLGCRWAAVAQRIGENRARVLAMWDNGAPGELFEYDLKGTPCAKLSDATDFCYFPDNVADHFPDDHELIEMNAVSYIGHVIRDSDGRMTGQIFALDERPMGSQSWRRELIELVARWVDMAFAQQRAMKKIRDRDQHLRDIAEVAADWLWEMGPDLRFTYFSDRNLEALGLDTMQLLGKTREELLSGNPEDDMWKSHLADLQAHLPFRHFEYTLRAADGTLRHLRISGKPVHDDNGDFLGYRGTGTDLTAEVTAREESMRNLQLLEAVFENLPVGISLTDADLNMVAFNRRFLEMLDFPPEEFEPGDPFDKFIRYNAERGEYGPGDAEEQVRERVDLAKLFQPHHFERPRSGGGTLEIRGSPTPSGGFVTTYADITERERGERALRESQASLENAQRIAQIGNWDWDIRAGSIAWSEQTYRILGITAEEFDTTYKSYIDRVHPDDRPKIRSAIDNALKGTEFSLDHRIVWPDGTERIAHAQGEITFGTDGKAALMRGTLQDVTEQRHAMTALREREQRISAIMDNIGEGLITIDEMGCIESANRMTATMLGYGADELIGQNVSLIVPQFYDDERGSYLKQHREAGEALALGRKGRELKASRKDSSQIEIVLTVSAIHHAGRRLYICSLRDVTEQKQYDRNLRVSQGLSARLGRILDQSSNEIYTFDADDLHFIQVNRGARENLGYTADELSRMGPVDLKPEYDDAAFAEALAPLRDGSEDRLVFETTHRRKDGSIYPIEARLQISRTETPAVFVAIVEDISERRHAEETVRQKTAFVELSKQVTAAANEAKSINQAMAISIKEICRHTDWPIGHVFLLDRGESGQLRSSHIWHMERPDVHGKLRAFTAAHPFAADTWNADHNVDRGHYRGIPDLARESSPPRVRLARDLGLKAMFGFPIVIGSEVCGMLEFFSDTPGEPSPATLEVMIHVGTQLGRVVERTSAQHSLLTAKEAAEYANRSKSEFLATMSHELRTPLNAIIGFSELMGNEIYGALGNSNYRDYVEDIRNSGLHLLEIINDILDVSKAEAGRIALSEDNLNLAETIDASVRLIRPRMEGKPIELKLDLPSAPIFVLADELRFRQVLLNLLSNSIKFTDSGSITIRAQVVPGIGLEVQIIDTGIGVCEADLDRIFEPFAQADATLARGHEGTGLGLPLSRKLIELHGGTLTLDSTFGVGSVATIRIPLQRVSPASVVA